MEVLQRLAAIALAFGLLLTACSSADDSQSTESPSEATSNVTAADLPDPCNLIDQADAEDIFGGEVAAGESGETPGSGGTVSGRDCDWGQGL